MSLKMRRLSLAAAVVAAALIQVPAAGAATEPPPGSDWTQATITEADGTALHADVFRPKGIPATQKTPVILSIGPYFNHSGQTGPAGPVEDTPFDPVTGGPSDRFYDYINGAHVFEKGYTWVQVDLRGFGGSNGCLDWGGPGEQSDVKSSVEWAASQPWSTGKVGMYGKSYDAVTGLLGIVQQPKGLSAVVSQEPLYDMYRYLYTNGVRFENSLATPALYDAIAGTPGGLAGDELSYNIESLNDTARPGCPVLNYLDQQDSNHASAYWKARDLIAGTKGKKTPLFLTQGFLENNTKPDGTWDLFNGMAGPKRAWFGMWDHVRGNDKDATGRLAMGRQGWFDETMRFFDRYVAGKSEADAPTEKDPPVAVEDNDGKWRSETAWPPPDSSKITTPLKTGSYTDDTTNNGSGEEGSPNGEGIWTFSPPLDSAAHFAGVPHIDVDQTSSVPNANLTADVYDVDAKGSAILLSRYTTLLNGSGKVGMDMYGNDWNLPAGHRVGVLITSSNSGWWTPTPTLQTVTVKSASIQLPWLSCARPDTIEGGPSIRLDAWKKAAPFTVDAATITGATSNDFPLPGALQKCSAAEIAGGPADVPASQGGQAGGLDHGCIDRRKFKFKIHQPKKDRITKVIAYVNNKRNASAKAKKGKRVTSIEVKKLPQSTFTVKIVATSAKGKRTVSVRRYKGCKKGHPTTTTGHR